MINTIEEAIEDIKAGKIVIVVDDEDREVSGDEAAAGDEEDQFGDGAVGDAGARGAEEKGTHLRAEPLRVSPRVGALAQRHQEHAVHRMGREDLEPAAHPIPDGGGEGYASGGSQHPLAAGGGGREDRLLPLPLVVRRRRREDGGAGERRGAVQAQAPRKDAHVLARQGVHRPEQHRRVARGAARAHRRVTVVRSGPQQRHARQFPGDHVYSGRPAVGHGDWHAGGQTDVGVGRRQNPNGRILICGIGDESVRRRVSTRGYRPVPGGAREKRQLAAVRH